MDQNLPDNSPTQSSHSGPLVETDTETDVKKLDTHPIDLPVPRPADERKKHRTQRAAGQFKSPVLANISPQLVSVRMTPTIQELERKLQILRRAHKVKQDGDEVTLKRLVHKWTEAGREVAWEVWDLVKENTSEDQSGQMSKGSCSNGWGWDEKPSDKKVGNWGWDDAKGSTEDLCDVDVEEKDKDIGIDEGDEEKRRDTLGTMLMQLGIAPETLGWNAEEEAFQDE